MITIKNDDFAWKKGLTVRELLEDLKARGKYADAIGTLSTIIIINGKIVATDQYSSRTVDKNDLINLMSFMMGG